MRYKEGHFIIHQNDVIILSVSHNRTSKYMKKKLIELKKVDKSVTIVGNHNSPH